MPDMLFLAAVFAILGLAGSLFAEDVRTIHDAERRVQRVPVRIR